MDVIGWFSGISNEWLISGFIAVLLLIIGIVIGKLSTFILKKISGKLEITKRISPSFVGLFIVVIRWSIYLSFIVWALKELSIPTLTDFITRVLLIIPSLTGALILLAFGFAIAIYLRGVVEDSEVTGWKILSQVLFYFAMYIFLVYAFIVALMPIDAYFRNMIILIFTFVLAVSIAYVLVKKELKEQNTHTHSH